MTVATVPAHAQRYEESSERGFQPVIRGFNVDEVRRIVPGVELNFDVYGTPGGRVYLQIDGAARNLQLNETEPGTYEGVYTVGTRDRISASSAVTANLRVGNQVTTGVLRESLLAGVGRHQAPQRGDLAVLPRIERFDVRGVDDLRPGNELNFMLRGTPGAKVDMTIAGTRGVFFLPEVRPGEYEGSYVIRRGDRIERATAVTANLRIGGRVTSATLGKPLQLLGSAPPPPREVRYCSNCATVEAINVIEVKGDGNYIGTIGGGVLGALAGSQVGGGNGRTVAEVAGALGGAYVGRNIDRQNDKPAGRHFEVIIRFANGGTQTVQYANDPGLRVGEKVKLNDGTLTRDN
ncbi:glycine zipper 2TM domain-containing protein [Massilia sp. PWRC2]|uniref:glycine zipper 2TM domain-containing protein n=1 Tax=Massilia sp. PWRC2 TaxID=2804626 RepID=UPI003CE72EBC